MESAQLDPHTTPGGWIEQTTDGGWRLSISAGKAGEYRLAQLDDYHKLRRTGFPWQLTCSLSLLARSSSSDLPGTWGFGLWNDPFGAGLASGGSRLLPALPQAAWFFFASKHNYLSFQENQPAQGALAAVFRSPDVPVWPFVPLAVTAPLFLIRPLAELARSLAGGIIQEDAASLSLDVTEWHDYQLDWRAGGVRFSVDGQAVFSTSVTPRSPLGLVMWIDNQYAAWKPDGSLNFGTLENPAAWIEIKDLEIG